MATLRLRPVQRGLCLIDGNRGAAQHVEEVTRVSEVRVKGEESLEKEK